jgi:hypothetical protein
MYMKNMLRWFCHLEKMDKRSLTKEMIEAWIWVVILEGEYLGEHFLTRLEF